MANSLSGKQGSISGVGNDQSFEWSIDLTVDIPEATTQQDSGWRTFVEGLYGATGSFSCRGNTLPSRGAVTVTCITDSGAAVTISGAAIVSVVSITSPVDGIVEFTGSFTFNGQPTVS